MRAGVGALLIALLTSVALPAAAAVVVTSERPESTALTIYPDRTVEDVAQVFGFDPSTGLALVTEWRTVEVPAGETTVRLRGVAEGIIPETAALEGIPARLVEQNQDFDLLSPGALIAGSIGERVRRVRTNAKTGRETVDEAVIRSGPGGVVLEIDGRFEAIGCGGGPERLVFERTPEGLTDRPTLSVTLNVREAGRYPVKLTYLAVGLLWQADYVAQARDDGGMDLLGWITLKNLSGTTFADAPTQVVAGKLETTGEGRATVVRAKTRSPACWPMDTTSGRLRPPPPPPPPAPPPAPAPPAMDMVVSAMRRSEAMVSVVAVMAVQSELGDYKLYSLPTPTTVAARQTKQVAMLSQDGVRFDRIYQFRNGDGATWEPDQVVAPNLLLRTDNTKAKGLGLPLPGGKLTILQTTPEGRRLLAAETTFENTAVNAPLELTLAPATDIEVRPRVVRAWKRGKRDLTEYEVAVTNDRAFAATFETVQMAYRPMRIVSESQRHQVKPAGRTWTLKLQPGETQTLRYTVETRP